MIGMVLLSTCFSSLALHRIFMQRVVASKNNCPQSHKAFLAGQVVGQQVTKGWHCARLALDGFRVIKPSIRLRSYSSPIVCKGSHLT